MKIGFQLAVSAALVSTGGCAVEVPLPDGGTPTVSQEIDRDRVLGVVEELRVDGSRDDLLFFRITAAAMDTARNLYVLDAGNSQILVLDESGTLVRVIGRQGQGPGEFSRPTTLSLHGDTIGVSDRGNRVHFFRTDGTVIATRAYLDVLDEDDLMTVSGVVGTPEGWLVSATAFFRRDASGNDANLAPVQRMRLLRLDGSGGVEPTGFHAEHEPAGTMVGAFFVQPPFVHRPQIFLDGLGRVHVIETGDYVIDVYNSSGELLHTVRNEIERDPVTRADLDEWREDRACSPGSLECDEARTDLALTMTIPEYKPVVSRLVAFHTGHIAVLRRGTDPDPDDRITMGEYDIFDPDGVFVGRLPVGLSPLWFDGRTLVVMEWNEVLVPSVVRYRVEYP